MPLDRPPRTWSLWASAAMLAAPLLALLLSSFWSMSAHGEEWDSGFAWFGASVFLPLSGAFLSLEVRMLLRRDAELARALGVIGFGVGGLMLLGFVGGLFELPNQTPPATADQWGRLAIPAGIGVWFAAAGAVQLAWGKRFQRTAEPPMERT